MKTISEDGMQTFCEGLSNEEFGLYFKKPDGTGFTKDEFNGLPKWKQSGIKRKAKLAGLMAATDKFIPLPDGADGDDTVLDSDVEEDSTNSAGSSGGACRGGPTQRSQSVDLKDEMLVATQATELKKRTHSLLGSALRRSFARSSIAGGVIPRSQSWDAPSTRSHPADAARLPRSQSYAPEPEANVPPWVPPPDTQGTLTRAVF